MTWEKFPKLNIPLCCLCLLYILLLSTELNFVFPFLLGCAFFQDSNCVFTSYHQHMSKCSVNADFLGCFVLYALLSFSTPLFISFIFPPLFSTCCYLKLFDCCKAIPEINDGLTSIFPQLFGKILGHSIYSPSFSVSEVFDSFLLIIELLLLLCRFSSPQLHFLLLLWPSLFAFRMSNL